MRDWLQNSAVASPSLSVQDNSPYYPLSRSQMESTARRYCTPPARFQQLPRDILTVLAVSSVSGARISEILDLTFADYLGDGRFIVRGKKRGRSFVITPNVGLFLFLPVGADPRKTRIFPITYKQIYRACVRAGVGFTPEGHANVARTHAHRYTLARLVTQHADKRTAGDCLHHNSGKSVEYYISTRRLVNG